MKRPKSIPRPTKQLCATPPESPHITLLSQPKHRRNFRARKSTHKLLAFDFSVTSNDWKWTSLHAKRSELFLPLTLLTGQTFRWRQTGPSQYTGVVKSHLFSLKQFEDDVGYILHSSNVTECEAKKALVDYLNLDISLEEIWADFVEADTRFAALAPHIGGIRVLRQDPIECLFQFICSSNNNIKRITKMVDHLSSLGTWLGSVGGFDFYEFPSLEQLACVSEEQLRDAGFGYRAKYIVGTVRALLSKSAVGEEWLASLRSLELQEVIEKLCTLPGIGPKVAACVALFSLDQHQSVPVDTHVWQIATKYLLPELLGTRLTPKLCQRVSDAFVSKFGKYAGWAQTVLFVAELPMQKAPLEDLSSEQKHSLTSLSIQSDKGF